MSRETERMLAVEIEQITENGYGVIGSAFLPTTAKGGELLVSMCMSYSLCFVFLCGCYVDWRGQ